MKRTKKSVGRDSQIAGYADCPWTLPAELCPAFFFNALGTIASTANSKANWEGAANTSTILETETDADNRQTQAVQLTAQALGIKLDEETAKKYEVQVMQELGIGPVDGLAQAVGVKGGFFDVLDALMNKVKKPARVIQAYLKNGGDPVVTGKDQRFDARFWRRRREG